MHSILVGTSVLAAFLGGMVALFAPCCISVMLPAFLASSVERRRDLVPVAGLFALGVAGVIVPIALGASGISRLIAGQHTVVFLAGGLLMIVMGAATAAGWRLPLPMLGMRPHQSRGPLSVVALGAFSGAASACCAPVLAGVVALSGAASSFVVALVLGGAYVFGMVAPLFAIALLWDRYDWGQSVLFKSRSVTIRSLGRTGTVAVTSLIGGGLLVAMGVLVSVIAFTGPSMPHRGWQVRLSTDLQHSAHDLVGWFGHLPGWVTAAMVLAAAAAVIRRALTKRPASSPNRDPDHGSGAFSADRNRTPLGSDRPGPGGSAPSVDDPFAATSRGEPQ